MISRFKNSGKFYSIFAALFFLAASVTAQNSDVQGLVAAMLSNTPLISDLEQLTDEIGGRPTGSQANFKAVEWGVRKFREAGVSARKEAFTMPGLWLGNSAKAQVSGDEQFPVRVVAMPFSIGTPPEGVTAPLVLVGKGTETDFRGAGKRVKGAFVLVETEVLRDIDGLFREYANAVEIEDRAFAAGALGVVYMSSRPQGLLYRHNASLGFKNSHPMLIMSREHAKRAMRLLRRGKKLQLTARINVRSGGPYTSYNVIGEIKGSASPEEFVVIGAHLDSWGLGTGANDNGCNAVMMIDIARQMRELGIQPKRTIRFVLWNGEEQGFFGSWGYVKKHQDELDRTVLNCTIDIGSGRIVGIFTNGRGLLASFVEKALQPVAAFGPFQQINAPIVGTDNYDFMMEGVANLVANHDPFNYGPNYHAESDTFDKVDLRQLKINSAIIAALAYGFANMDITYKRQTRAQVQHIIDNTDLGKEMRMFRLMPDWENGKRGRK